VSGAPGGGPSARSVDVSLLAAVAAGVAGDVEEACARVVAAGVPAAAAREAFGRLCRAGLLAGVDGAVELTGAGAGALLAAHGEIAAALDPSPAVAGQEECPSLPWLTAIETEWIEALSFNWAVEPARLAALLPAPLQPELHRGCAWVQVLISSLRELRPQGLPALFGVCFHQVSYRAAVRFRDAAGEWRRGGYFVKSETDDAVMRAVGNRLAEFKFHDFGAAAVVMVRQGPTLSVGVDPQGAAAGRLAAVVDTTPLPGPPPGSRWASLEELQEPLVDCFDAFGVDTTGGWLYTLTIDRGPWKARFVRPVDLYCEWLGEGPLAGAATFDSLLHVARCRYRWRPLRRERLPVTALLAGDAGGVAVAR
jgi:uncharacterized protein YqjF (DUF2071 family)